MNIIDMKGITAKEAQCCWDALAETHRLTSALSDDTDDLTFDCVVEMPIADGVSEDDVNHVSIHVTITGEHRGA